MLLRTGDLFGFYEDDQKDVKAFFCVSIKSKKARLRYVYVRPNERGKGLFKGLIEAIEDICMEAGVVYITATSTNLALPLYLKNAIRLKNLTPTITTFKKKLENMNLFSQTNNALISQFSEILEKVADLDTDERVRVLNILKIKMHEISPMKNEPVDCVLWIPNTQVFSNDYNPNSVAPPEMELLRHSIS